MAIWRQAAAAAGNALAPLAGFFRTGPEAPRLTDPKQIDALYRRSRFSAITTITLGYGCAYTCRLSLAAVKKPLIDAGIFDASQLGLIGSAFFYTYAVGKLTNGFLADHANLKRFFSFALLCSALVNLAMGSTSGFLLWALLWGLNGYFQGFGAPTGAVTLGRWFANHERGRFYGVFSASHSLGEGTSFLVLPLVVTAVGTTGGFFAPGLLCLAVAVIAYFGLRDRPETLGLPPVAEWKGDAAAVRPKATGSTWRAQLSVLKMPTIWVIGLAATCMTVTRYAVNSWGLLYLQEAKGFSPLSAGAMLWLNSLAGIAGALAFGLISDHFFNARRPPVNLAFGLVEIAALSVLLFTPAGHPGVILGALIVYGFTLNGLLASLGGLFAIDVAPKRAAGAAMGVMGVFAYVGAGVQEAVSGYLINRGTSVVEGVRSVDFTAVTLFWLGASVLSLILAASLWRTRPVD